MPKPKNKSRLFRTMARGACIGALAAGILTLAGCASFNTYATESRPLTRPITIDGRTDDWQGELFVVPGERMMIGFVNDGRFLYIAVLVEEAFQRTEVLYQGLTVWFDPKGGSEKEFGIRYPLGLPARERPIGRVTVEGEAPRPVELPEGALSELEILHSEKEPPQRLLVADLKGVELKVTPSTGLLVYEMKIPLVADIDHPLAIGTAPGRTIGVGFETPKPDTSSLPGGASGAGMGGGGRGGGMGGGGRGGGMGGAGGRSGMTGLAEPLKIWAIVQLAPGPGAASAGIRTTAKIQN
jgi:uncharacterized membrane protein YgcG